MSVPTYLYLVQVRQMLGHGLDNQLEEEPGELKPGRVQSRVNHVPIFIWLISSRRHMILILIYFALGPERHY